MNESSAGGSATAGGVRHEGACLAWAGAYMLAEQPLPAWATGRRVVAVGAQTSRPVDDVALVTDAGGWITIQAKKGLNLGAAESSALGEALAQLVKIFRAGVPNAAGAAGLRPIDPARDRVLVLTDVSAPQTVVNVLVPVVDRLRELPLGVPVGDVPKNETEQRAFELLRGHLSRSWRTECGMEMTEADLRALCRVLAVYRMDFSDVGQHRQAAVTMLEALASDPLEAAEIWRSLEVEAQRLADVRSYLDRDRLVGQLEAQGIPLNPVSRLRAEIARLGALAAENVRALASALTISTPDGPLALTRALEATVSAADGNLAITGAPGAGKTVLLHALAESLSSTGTDLVVLRAENLGSTTGQTRVELNTEHDLAEILRGWTGPGPGVVLIDGLDQTRGADASTWLPRMVKDLSETRWRFVATIRAFDLKHGRGWRAMFPGQPVDPAAADGEIGGVRHLLVEDLTEHELLPLRTHSERMAELLDDADPRLRRLLSNPFNLDIAGQLLADADADLSTIHSRLDLLDRYWQLRVVGDAGGVERNRAVDVAVRAMLKQGRQIVRPLDLPAAQASAAAVEQLQHQGVLRELPRRPGTAESPLAFAHPVLFDYAVALFALGDADRPASFAEVLDANPNLAITVRPSLEYRLATIWGLDETRRGFWLLALRLAADSGGHPLAAAAAAQVVAREVDSSDSLAELVRACTGEISDPSRHWSKINAHRMAFLTAAAISRVPQTDAAHGALAEFAAKLASTARATHDVGVALLAAQLGTRVMPNKDQAAASLALEQWVSCVIDCMAVAFEDLSDPSRVQLAGIGSRLLGVLAPHDAGSTAETVRRLLDPQSLAMLNVSSVIPVINQLPAIARSAPELAVDIGVSVWDYQETRDGRTTLGASALLPLSSTHAQDLESVRYGVGATYRLLLKVDTAAGVCLLLRIVERPQMYYPWSPATSDGLRPHLRSGKPLETSGGHGAVREMAQALCEWLGELAEQQDPNTFSPIIDTVINGLHHDEVWNRLLRQAVVAGSARLASALTPVLASKSLIANSTTWMTAGHLAARLSPQLGADQHAELESAILELVSAANAGSSEQVRQGLTARARTLLNALSADKIGSAAAAVIAQAESPALLPALDDGRFDRFAVTSSWEPDVSMPAPMAQLADEIRRVTEQARSTDERARTQSHPLLLDLWTRLSTVAAGDAPAPEAEAYLHELRLTLAERLAIVPELTPDTELGEQVLAVLIDAVPATAEDAALDHDEWQSGFPAWGSTQSTNAVQGLVHLIFRPEWRHDRLTDLATILTGLLDGSDVVYRYLAAQALPALYQEPDALIDELERRLCSEPDRNNATQLLHHLARYWHQHPQRVDGVLQRASGTAHLGTTYLCTRGRHRGRLQRRRRGVRRPRRASRLRARHTVRAPDRGRMAFQTSRPLPPRDARHGLHARPAQPLGRSQTDSTRARFRAPGARPQTRGRGVHRGGGQRPRRNQSGAHRNCNQDRG